MIFRFGENGSIKKSNIMKEKLTTTRSEDIPLSKYNNKV